MAEKITTSAERKIIEDFAKEIAEKRERGSHPEKTVIDFRNDRVRGEKGERDIWIVPIKLLRFRKDNGRIASDVTSYEKLHGRLDEALINTQKILKEYLQNKDPESNVKLMKLIEHSGQLDPAIITSDGFLINGNRRKMVLEELFEKTRDKRFEVMKVVILPGKGEPGGPPTIKEIEQIENRYQLQSDGKSEYTNFDRAISMKRKIKAGMSLEEQLKDDPTFVNLNEKEFKKQIQKYNDEFLGPLECIDNYLEQLARDGMYDSISEGRSDKEGRWYAFIDYYKLYKQLKDEKRRIDLGVEEDEVGDIENVVFKIIRKKDFPQLKSHEIIRKIPKILTNKGAKKDLLKIKIQTKELPKADISEHDDFKTIDRKWGNLNSAAIVGRVTEALRRIDNEMESEGPLTLLYDALKKLNHDKMVPEDLEISKLDEAFKRAKEIQERAHYLEKAFWELKQVNKKLLNKK